MDIHISRELLRAVSRGEISPHVLAEVGLQHLTSLCPHCREEYSAWRRELVGGLTYDAAFKVLPTLLAHQHPVQEKKERAAQQDFRALLRLSQEQRLAKVRRANERFRGAVLAGLLLNESKKHVPAKPQEAYELAEVAETVLQRSSGDCGAPDYLARAAAYMGNARRTSGDLAAAKKKFDFCRFIMKQQGVTDPLICAEIDSCEAVLRMDQRHFAEAETLLNRSITLYVLGGEQQRIAHPLLTLGALYYYQNEYEKAISVTQLAADRASALQDECLHVSAHFHLALYLCDAGLHDAADETLRNDPELFRRFCSYYSPLRWRWLEGKIAAGFRRWTEAEGSFRYVRAGFVEQEVGYDAAIVSLDLALVLVAQGRSGELKQLAEEIAVFDAHDMHHEAVAALMLFEEAVRQESVTADWVTELALYLKKARYNPTLRFRKMPA